MSTSIKMNGASQIKFIISCLLILTLLTSSSPLLMTPVSADPCSAYALGCDSCVKNEGCGWCSWGQGSCMSGDWGGPAAGQCHETGTQQSNWYFSTCTDQCYLLCELVCSSTQSCVIDLQSQPQCSCETKSSIIIAAVVGSIFCFCLTLTIFVWIRRRNALKYSRRQNAPYMVNGSTAPYAVLPKDQPPIIYHPQFPQTTVGYQPPTTPTPQFAFCDADASHGYATVYCNDCDESFCGPCDVTLHSRKKTASHDRETIGGLPVMSRV